MKKIPVRHISTTLKEPAFSGSFSIRDVAGLLSGNDMVQELHRHSFFYVLVLEKGMGEHIIDFVSYPVTDHTVFFMRPGQVHQLILKNGSTGYLLEFSNDFYSPLEEVANQVLRKVSSKNYCPLEAERFNKLHTILSYIFEEYTAKQEKYKEVIKSGLDILFIELARQSRNPQNILTSSSQYTQERLDELLALVELHISTNKQVSEYAAMMNLSTYQLNAITKKTLGKTCSQFIDEHIILEAKRYLLATTNLVNQVADQLGYEDVSYFTRFFKKHTRYTPEAFRQNFK